MLRQSNDPASAYVFVSVTQDGVRVESKEGGSSSPAYASGSNAAAPVWLKLERKEGRVYVYEFDDGMNWSLVTTVALSLSSPFNLGLATSTPETQVQAQFAQVSAQTSSEDGILEVPFAIDTAEVEGASTIWADIFGERTQLNGATSGTFTLPKPLTEGDIFVVTVSKEGVGGIAEDVLISGVKESLTFNAANTARALVISDLRMFQISSAELMDAYSRMDAHPSFPSLVQLLQKEKGIPEDEEGAAWEQMIDDTFDITISFVSEYRNIPLPGEEPKDPSGSSLITPQSVQRGFPITSSFTLRQLKDPGEVVIEASSMLDFRLLVFESSVLNGATLNLDFLAANQSSTAANSYLGSSEGIRRFIENTNSQITLAVPSTDCKVYSVVASAFMRGPKRYCEHYGTSHRDVGRLRTRLRCR